MHLPLNLPTTGDPDAGPPSNSSPQRNTSTPRRLFAADRTAQRRRWIFLLAIPAALVLLTVALAPGVLSAHVEPTEVPSSKRVKDCTHFEPDGQSWTELRVDPGRNGVFFDDQIEVTVTNYTGKTFDWNANRSIVEAVYVRGGATDASNLYEYNPASGGDTDLTTPGTYNEIQYISFCYGEDVPVQEVPTIEVLKTPDGAEVDAEEQFDWEIEVINSGTVDANNVTVNDTIPAGLLVFSATPSQGSCMVLGQDVTCDLGTVPAGETATITINVLATGEVCGRIDNTATVTAEGTPGDTTTVSDDGHVFIVCADAQVEKVARDASVPLGDDVVFDVTVTANGPNASENVTLEDPLPEISGGWTLSGANATDCSIDASDVLTCDFGTIQPGDTREVTVTGATGDASDCGVVENTATIDSDLDLDDTNDASTDQAQVECPDVAVTKTAGEPTVDVTGTANFTITVEAVGGASAPNVVLTDTLPGTGWTLSGADAVDCQPFDGQNLSCDFGTLAGGQMRTVFLDRPLTADDCDGLTNTATVSADGDTNPTNDEDSASINVNCGDLTVDKDANPAAIEAGDDAVFDIVVTNQGPGPATDATLSDTLPDSGWTLSGANATDCTLVGTSLTCDFGTIAEGDTREITLSRPTTTGDCGVIANTVTVDSAEELDVTDNEDTAQITVLCPDLELEKTPDGASQDLGDVFDFTITVRNNGDGAALDAEVSDDVPVGLVVLQVAPPGDCSFTGQQVTCTFDRIEPGEEIEITVTVQAMLESCGFNQNLAEVSASNEPSDVLDDNDDTGDVTVDCPSQRVNIAHRPNQTPEGFDESFLSDRGLYVNPIDSPHSNVTVRLYGSEDLHAPETYPNASDPHDRTIVPSDSATFNPALIENLDAFGTITSCNGEDAHLKKYLRTWYEPGRALDGSRVDAGHYTATVADVVQVESTYRLIDAASYTPATACEGDSSFPFPTEGVHIETDDGHEQPGLDTMTTVDVGDVSDGTGTDGTVELEKNVTLETGESVQYLDHRVTFKNVVTGLDGLPHAQIDVEYLGNTFPDAKQTIDLRERQYFTRSNTGHEDPLHEAGSSTRTFYTEVTNIDGDADVVTLLVGKEIAQGDTFYVDGVRYDVPAVTTEDGELAAITLRTPIPKSDPEGSWTTVTDPTREEQVDGQFQVQDNSEVTTQWLVEVDQGDPIPVDPPFNQDTYTMVDDTDVQLWEQDPVNDEENFPYGEPEESLPGGDGMPMFPEGERYLTMEDPSQDWIDHFDAQPTGHLDEGTDHASSLPNRVTQADGINADAWAPSVLSGPHAFDPEAVNFNWTAEWTEGRMSKNVLELRSGDAFDAETRASKPDRYTTFLLPDRPNPVSRLTAELAFASPCSRMDVVPGGPEPADCDHEHHLLGGDYIVTTSYKLQDQTTRHAFALDPEDNTVRGSLAGDGHALDDVDLYFQHRNLTLLFDDERPAVADTTARLYGEEGDANQAPDVYGAASDAFDARVIPKDSATWSPALIRHTDPEAGTITACGEDAHLKKHLRVWYEPGHDYHGPRTVDEGGTYVATVGDAIQIESTYHLLDASSYRPTTACAETSRMPFPTEGANLEAGDGHEQPGLDTLTTVRLGDVSPGTSTQGTVELEREVTLDVGDSVQFLDHNVEMLDIVEVLPEDTIHAQVDVGYLGNHQGQSAQTQTHDVRDRIYMTRANDDAASPAHDAGSSTATWYVELVSFDPDDETATLLVGKEIAAGDVFYVDGLRYEVPAVATEDGELAHLTLRTPIPKSDTQGSWTSVTDATREQEIDGQWQVEDNSQVTTQWLVEVDNKDPIPVDPPFNHETYTMVDDVDVQLWEPTENAEHFPWGPADESLPAGTGMPMFPEGARYLTMANPSQAWKSFFDVEATGYLDAGASYADEMPHRLAEADGVNHDAWERQGDDQPPAINEENATFYWLKEWYEGRYSTNLLELPAGDAFRGEQIATLPDRYTEFVLPDRPNPVSLTEGTLAIGDDPACTRTDVVDAPACERTVPLLGGDYAILTSLVEDASAQQPERAQIEPLPGTGGDGSDDGSSDAGDGAVHAYDTDGDCVLADDELLTLVSDWGAGAADDDTLLSGVAAWGKAPGTYC